MIVGNIYFMKRKTHSFIASQESCLKNLFPGHFKVSKYTTVISSGTAKTIKNFNVSSHVVGYKGRGQYSTCMFKDYDCEVIEYELVEVSRTPVKDWKSKK